MLDDPPQQVNHSTYGSEHSDHASKQASDYDIHHNDSCTRGKIAANREYEQHIRNAEWYPIYKAHPKPVHLSIDNKYVLTNVCQYQQYRKRHDTYLTEYDENVVRTLISKVETFNDGLIKVHWRFHEEFPEYKSEETGTGLHEASPCLKYAVYSSDMFYMKKKNDGDAARKVAAEYYKKQLSIEEKEITWFHDDKDEEDLFYQSEFMKMTALAREGKCETIVVRNVGDLHLQKVELHDFLFWTLPRLQTRFISVEDHFDSEQIAADEWEQTVQIIYEKYRGIVRSDQLLHRKDQRRSGERIAKEPVRSHCTLLYGYYHDENGCYADPEAIGWVKKIFQMFMDGKSHFEIVEILNEENVPSLTGFFNKYGLTKRSVGDITWNSEKLVALKRNKKYTTECKYKKLCESKGRHCERKPIIDQETFDKVNEIFKYRIKRFEH